MSLLLLVLKILNLVSATIFFCLLQERKMKKYFENVGSELENCERLQQSVESILDDKDTKLQQLEANQNRIQDLQTNIKNLINKKAEYLQLYNNG